MLMRWAIFSIAILIVGAMLAEQQFNSIIATATKDVSVMEHNKPENILGNYRAGTLFVVTDCAIKSSPHVFVQLPDRQNIVGVLVDDFVLRRTGPIRRILPNLGTECDVLLNAFPDRSGEKS